METAVLTLRVPQEIKDRLDKLAEATHRSKSFLGTEAIQRYVDLEAWQVAEIQQALKESDNEDFASESEVAAVVGKYAG
jgi:RHH-type rel operon transcriptional repressor/antitoxin RelB